MNRRKFTEVQMKRSVLKNIKKQGPIVNVNGQEIEISQAGIADDYSRLLLMPDSPDILTATAVGIKNPLGYLRTDFIKACNNIRAGGGIPFMVQDAIIMPEDDEKLLKAVIKELDDTAHELGVVISGGHTEIVTGISEPVVSMTVVGISKDKSQSDASEKNVNRYKKPDIHNIKPGTDIVMCGFAGMLGTVILYNQYRNQLLMRYSEDYLRPVEKLKKCIVLGAEMDIAMEHGMVYAHDISTGGVFAALWELADGADCGIRICHDNIPILQETIEICEFADFNPYMADGSGAVLIVCENGNALCDKLYNAGYEAAVIGAVTAGRDRVVIHDGEERFLTPPKGGDIYRMEAFPDF